MFKPSPWMLKEIAAAVGAPLLSVQEAVTAPLPGRSQAVAPPNVLARIYVEVTTRCNLACRTCVRNAWSEPLEHMAPGLYSRLLAQLAELSRPITLVFSGYGEPFAHPQIMEMLRAAREAGLNVEVVTNGTSLDEARCAELVDLGVDRLWFSVDGLTADRYAAIRCGGQLETVRDHIWLLSRVRQRSGGSLPEIGLVFVAMKSNVAELPALHWLAMSVHASDVLVTNLLPHTPEMVDEILYRRSIMMGRYSRSGEMPRVHVPRLDFDDATGGPLLSLLASASNLDLAGADLAEHSDFCPFIQGGAAAVRWDGAVSPCPPLLHSHPVYVAGRWKHLRHASFGNIGALPLADIWTSDAYCDFRQKVRCFDFSPCVFCGGCDRADGNEEDCFGNRFPVCGGCLWAQGVVRCP